MIKHVQWTDPSYRKWFERLWIFPRSTLLKGKNMPVTRNSSQSALNNIKNFIFNQVDSRSCLIKVRWGALIRTRLTPIGFRCTNEPFCSLTNQKKNIGVAFQVSGMLWSKMDPLQQDNYCRVDRRNEGKNYISRRWRLFPPGRNSPRKKHLACERIIISIA